MPILSLAFEDSGNMHEDLVLRLDAFDRRCDSYYLALDPGIFPDREDAEKVTLVLTRLLSQWLSDVESMAPGDTTYLPYEFDDQCSGWLQVTAAEDGNLDVLPVWSVLEGWAFIPSAYASGQQAVGRTEPVWANLQPQRMSREEALACISAAIAVAEGQTRT